MAVLKQHYTREPSICDDAKIIIISVTAAAAIIGGLRVIILDICLLCVKDIIVPWPDIIKLLGEVYFSSIFD